MIHMFKVNAGKPLEGKILYCVTPLGNTSCWVTIIKLQNGHCTAFAPKKLEGTEIELVNKWKEGDGVSDYTYSTDPGVLTSFPPDKSTRHVPTI
jgi:hypothetical protein